jgi:beta-phosphoglucomutase
LLKADSYIYSLRRLNRPIRSFVFDLDGVLVNSTSCHRAAFEEVLRPMGILDFDYTRYAGWRTADAMAAEFRRAGLPGDAQIIAEASAKKSALARKKLAESNPVAEGCGELLERLHPGYLLALASSGSRPSVNAFLEANRFGDFFDSVLSGDDVAHAKPHPEIYLKSFSALGLAPDACIVVEDALSGVEAAVRAGARVIGITGTCDKNSLESAGAARVVDRLIDIAQVVAL